MALELRDLLFILLAAGVVAVVMQRLRLALIPAYLVAGAIIGPGGWGLVSSPQSVASISDLALILLLFSVGLNTDFAAVRHRWKQMLAVGVASTIAAILVLWPLGLLAGWTWGAALAIAIAFSNSSTAVVIRILQDRRELHTADGRLSFGVLLIQDFMAIGGLMALPALAALAGATAAGGSQNRSPLSAMGLGGAAQAGIAALAVGLMIVIGRFVLPRLLLEAARARSSEAITVVSTAAALGAAGLTQAIGLSPALGAFVGGFLLSSTPFRHQLSGQVVPLRDLFAAVFFTAIGMAVDLPTAVDKAHVILLIAGAVIAIKAVAISVGCWVCGATGHLSAKVGLTLAEAGEFSLVIIGVAASLGLLPPDVTVTAVAVVIVSLVITPLLLRLARTSDRWLPDIDPPPWAPSTQSNEAHRTPHDHSEAAKRPTRVIIAGYGLVGRVVSDELTAKGALVTIVDLNPQTVQTQSRLGRRVVFGDVSNPEVLESIDIEHADALVLTIPDEDSVLRACQAARKANPGIFIIARTNYVSKGMVATGLGANTVIIEELATAQSMETAIGEFLQSLGADKA